MPETPSPFFADEHAALRARARSWVEDNLIASGKPGGNLRQRAAGLVSQLGRAGLLQCVVPRTFGGAREAVQARDLCIVREELARGDALADTMFALQALGACPIALFGNEAQKRRYLGDVSRGAIVAAFALTEPEAGSDVGAVQTQALRRDDGFSISGTKCFISNAGLADFYIVFASTGPESKGKGISCFSVPANTPGLLIKESTELLSPHPIGVLEFTDCKIANDALTGSEGQGLQIAFATLDLLRCTVGAAAVGFAQRALDEALRFSQERRQFGRALADFQGIEFKLADMATELEAARLLVYQAAWAHDLGGEAKMQSSMAKLYATEAAQRIVDQAVQIHGARGLVAGSIMERLYRDVRALRIYEGTSEIQKIIIARELRRRA
jgi:acyl-CoA dehydrogenase